MSDNWFSRSWDVPDDTFSGNSRKPWRFYLKTGEERRVIFLDPISGEEPVQFHEHNVNINGKWNNHFTCTAGIPGHKCFFCEQDKEKEQNSRYFATAFTVLDTTEYTTKSGEKGSNTKKLFIAKSRTMRLLQRKLKKAIEETGGLRTWSMDCYRSGGKVAAVGDDFVLGDRVDIDNMEEVDITPFDYMEVFKPLSYEEQKAVYGGGSTTEGSETGDEDSFPVIKVERL